VLANGRRCPNAALPQLRFCGVEAHQALEAAGTTQLGADGQPVLPGDEVAPEPVDAAGDSPAVDQPAASAEFEAPALDAAQAAADEQELEALTEVEAENAAPEGDVSLEPAPEASEPDASPADEPVAEEQA
jgi:N utilization substance protein A